MAGTPPCPDRWKRLEELFHEAVARPPEERARFLDRHAGDLREELEELLRAEAGPDRFLDRAAFPHEPWIGRRIGPYTVAAEIGRGGSSLVFEGRRSDGELDDRVAIKILRAPPWGDQDEATLLDERFRRERQILAGLDHPHIARLRDAGTLEDGRPYFVMDRVDGLPLDRYADHHQLGVEARIELFLAVCRAVQHAHRSLVVHRDLKPSNILIADDGTPRLLDFGIAKPLAADPPLDETRTWQRALTPRYASPEQVAGEAITTATDVYSLGIVLHELLTGRSPSPRGGETGAAAWRRAVVERQPEPPSRTALRAPAEEAELLARDRRTSPAALARRLRGDLDTIVSKALREEPGARYGSVEALAADLERHLARQPIAARSISPLGRLGRFASRNPVGTGLGLALAVLLAGFSVYAHLQGQRMAHERDKAEQSLSFLVELFETADPLAGSGGDGTERGADVTAREILERGARRVATELDDQPEVRSALLGTIGESYRSLGYPNDALPLVDEAYRIARRDRGPDAPETLALAESLARIRADRGEARAALALHRSTYGRRARVLGPDDPATLRSLAGIGLVLRALGRLEEADETLREALARGRQSLGIEHPETARVLNDLANVRADRGDAAGAELLHRQALAIRRQTLGDRHPDVAESLQNLAVITWANGRLAESNELYRRAAAIWEETLDPDHPYLETVRMSLAVTARDLGRYGEAAPILEEIAAHRRARLGRHPKVVVALHHLALLEEARGRFDVALPLHREVLALSEEVLGEEHSYVSRSLTALASTLVRTGRLEEAASVERQAEELIRRQLGPEHPLASEPRLGLGEIALARGDLAAAEPLLRESLEHWRRTLPEGHLLLTRGRAAWGAWLVAAKRWAQAEPVLLAALGDDGPSPTRGELRRRILQALVTVYDSSGRPELARERSDELDRLEASLVASAAPSSSR